MSIRISKKAKEITEKFGLDFKIEKLPLVAHLPNMSCLSGYYGLLNDKTGEIINTVKGGYGISQNDEIIEMVLRGAKKFGELSVQNAGSINGGRRVYVQLAVDGVSKVSKDKIKRYVTIIDSNDGSSGLSVGIGDLTMSCQNQFFRFRKKGQFKAKHTSTIEDKIRLLPKQIEDALKLSLKMIDLYKDFQSTAVSKELAHQMVEHLIGYNKFTEGVDDKGAKSINQMNALYANLASEMKDKGDNLWGLHSGVTKWTTHEKSAPRREGGRLESIMVGTNYKTNQKSLDFVQQILQTA